MAAALPALLSAVIVVRNLDADLPELLGRLSQRLARLATDHEMIVVDNGSSDGSLGRLRDLTGAQGVPNLQVYCLTKQVDIDTAAWAGIDRALGDYVAVLDPLADDADFLPAMIAAAGAGADVVFARNEAVVDRGLFRRAVTAVFSSIYRWLDGVDLDRDAPRYRLLSRRIVNFVMQHPVPTLSYRLLPATAGFQKTNLSYRTPSRPRARTSLAEDFDHAVRLIVSSTRAPMRLVTLLSLSGALFNVVYSAYVIGVFLLKKDVAPGWVTLSLQQSGMFFLLSLVLLVLGEYILHMAALSTEGPRYHIAQEFTSTVQTRRSRLNVEDASVVPLNYGQISGSAA